MREEKYEYAIMRDPFPTPSSRGAEALPALPADGILIGQVRERRLWVLEPLGGKAEAKMKKSEGQEMQNEKCRRAAPDLALPRAASIFFVSTHGHENPGCLRTGRCRDGRLKTAAAAAPPIPARGKPLRHSHARPDSWRK